MQKISKKKGQTQRENKKQIEANNNRKQARTKVVKERGVEREKMAIERARELLTSSATGK
jgi:hypothetical protein